MRQTGDLIKLSCILKQNSIVREFKIAGTKNTKKVVKEMKLSPYRGNRGQIMSPEINSAPPPSPPASFWAGNIFDQGGNWRGVKRKQEGTDKILNYKKKANGATGELTWQNWIKGTLKWPLRCAWWLSKMRESLKKEVQLDLDKQGVYLRINYSVVCPFIPLFHIAAVYYKTMWCPLHWLEFKKYAASNYSLVSFS